MWALSPVTRTSAESVAGEARGVRRVQRQQVAASRGSPEPAFSPTLTQDAPLKHRRFATISKIIEGFYCIHSLEYWALLEDLKQGIRAKVAVARFTGDLNCSTGLDTSPSAASSGLHATHRTHLCLQRG